MQKIVISLGDPAGIGAEIIARAMQVLGKQKRARYLLIGDARVFERAKKIIGADYFCPEVAEPNFDLPLQIFNPSPNKSASAARLPAFGKISATAGDASFRWVEYAAKLCLGCFKCRADALVTAPICKAAWHAAEKKYPGHTELLAEICRSRDVLMMLSGGGLRVALVTIHEPLADVAKLITGEKILTAAEILNRELRARFGIANPRIAVLGLNPHNGENGTIGKEEIQIIRPAIARLRRRKIAATLVAADAAFYQMIQRKWDGILAMYHDQGLAALKTVAFNSGVNITLGLPIIRVSPDHGTAFDLAGSGRADPSSFIEAVRTAQDFVSRSSRDGERKIASAKK